MDAHTSTDSFLFGQFRLDRVRGLSRFGDAGVPVPVSLGSRALDVLRVLIERHGDLVPKDEIMAAVWAGTTVEEANLTVQISTLRRVLDHQGNDDQSSIQTVPGRGYRFVLPVTRAEEGERSLSSAPLPDPAPIQEKVRPSRPRWQWLAVFGGFAGALVLVAVVWIGGWFGSTTASDQSGDRRQSVIVLPFENSSGDPAQDDLAGALTRELTDRIALGRYGAVVPAVTANTFRGKSVDLRAIGHQFDVHFALVGNVGRRAGRVISSASVYDIADGKPIWSRQFDLPDGHSVRATIVQRTFEGFWQATIDEEADRAKHDHPDRLDKRDLMDIVLSTSPLSAPTKQHLLEKMSLVERVLAIDPNDLQGLERQARLHTDFAMLGYSSDPAADLAIADKAAERLLEIDPNNLLTLRARTAVLRARADWPAAEAVVRRAITLQPTEANRHYELGFILMGAGRQQEALQSFQNAKRFADGSDPLYVFDASIAMADLALGQFAEAIAMARASISDCPSNTGHIVELPWLALIAATSESGQNDKARAYLQTFLATPRSWHNIAQVQEWPAFVANQNLLNGLRTAGMPPE
jgi:DNA-binding winged helix-turn-helix (wHTH) protein/TolB-like protein/tetratricopeptide (TPR) repeat protein